MVEDKLLEQSSLYVDLMEEGVVRGGGEGAEKSIIAVFSVCFGLVLARMSERIHNFRERNSARLGELIKFAATVKDIGEFERKLDRMG